MSAMIQFQNVSKCYPDDIIAVQDINLTIEQGEYVFLWVLPEPESRRFSK